MQVVQGSCDIHDADGPDFCLTIVGFPPDRLDSTKNNESAGESIHERADLAVQEHLFVPEYRNGSNDSGIGECFRYGNFILSLTPTELGGRVQRHVQMRDLDEIRSLGRQG